MDFQNRFLIGVGLDSHDGHIRITSGQDFRLFGGSEETHSDMQEKIIRLTEAAEKKGMDIKTMPEEALLDLTGQFGIPYCRMEQETK